ncbi:PKD domain-containing protein [uncultured Pseudokineococcus sp.]|uniref:PKD domain-containing protein n=1 Tax=uncultured Pseudokineococcus sp. TaxID=1642928 RepID=UPI00262CE35E|nr:PKD domain-containing protein [uncultured Pseudokineococcus sp.]
MGVQQRTWTTRTGPGAALLAALAALLLAVTTATDASAVNAPHAGVVSARPAATTPDVLDGAVLAITQVGGTVYVGGSFTQVRDRSTGTTLARRSLFAMDATTGRVLTSFAPALDGAVNSLSTDGTSLFAGGYFSTVNGTTQRRVAKLTSSGALASGQPPMPNSGVNEVVVSGQRLYVGGSFTSMGGMVRSGLAAVDRTSGRLLADVDVPFEGQYNGGATNVKRFDVSPDGRTLVAVGNFTTVGGQPRQQVAVLDLPATGPAAVSSWATDRYDAARNTGCSKNFDTWTRDLDISPDGTYVVISTTGAYGGGANAGVLCDTTTRWEIGADAKAPGQQPTWVDYTGGDTTYGVAVTGAAVYVGGHMRWQNNAFQGDQAGPGAVPREGIAALDPKNGLPLSWNPGKERGVGAQALFATSQGLWVGSDTGRFAGLLRQRLAFLPLAGGTSVPEVQQASLPGSVYAVQRGTAPSSVLYRVNAGGPLVLSQDDGPDWAADTATTSPLRTSGSSTSSGTTSSLDASVPAGTPRALFDTYRWDGAGGDEMRWRFPVTAGRTVEVRLLLANLCSCTSRAGQRKFDVAVDGQLWLDDLDLSASPGHTVGTVLRRTVVSDGSVDVDFLHVLENPMVNAIEIVDPAASGTSAVSLVRRPVDATGTPVGPSETVSTDASWAAARGTFLVGTTMYYGTSTGLLARDFTDGVAGAPREVDLHDDPEDGRRIPFPTGQLTGAFFDPATHRLFYTVNGDARLLYRYFTPESEVVGAQTFVGDAGGLDLSGVTGMALADGRVLVAGRDGSLRSIAFTGGALRGPATTLSSDGSWASRGLVVAGPAPEPPNRAPSVVAAVTCAGLTCTFDATGSTDADGTITGYAWDFGDGTTGTGASTQHPYTTPGERTATLTVTDDDGATATTSVTAAPEPPPTNVAPTAAATATCDELACTFDATGSTDTDGTITAHAWDFGDGTTGTGATTQHTYATAGDYTATLTITDDDGATATTTTTLSPRTTPPPAPTTPIAFRAAADNQGNAGAATVTLPASLRAGDQLLVVLTTNRDATLGAPTGAGDWGQPVQQGTGDKGQVETTVYAKTADGTEAGRTLRITFDEFSKYTITATAHSGAVLESATLAAETANRAAHTTPPATTTVPGSWVVSYWADKTSATTGWTSPAATTDRAETIGTGAGRITSLLTDSGAPLPTGPHPGLTATADSATLKATTLTLVLHPTPTDGGGEGGDGTAEPPNRAPSVVAAVTCAGLTCTFDATGSTDADGTITGYAWDFGDGTTGTGASTQHPYTTPGERTATLTVTDDDGATATTSVTAAPEPPPTNVAPTAAATATCDELACTFDATGSTDTDGTITAHAWDFGDGTTGTGATTQHTYATAGDYTATLTVTDDDGATATTTTTLSPRTTPPPAPTTPIAFRAAADNQGNAGAATVTLPASLRAGDQLLVVLTTNRDATLGAPTGAGDWGQPVQQGTGDKGQVETTVYAKTADGTEAGRTLRITFDEFSKYTITATAHSGAVLESATLAAETANRAAHTTPPATTTVPGSWVVSYWADKTSATTGWTSPAATTDRAETIGTGAGRITSLLTDSGAPLPTGPHPGLTATADSATLKATTLTLVLHPTPTDR